MRVLHYIITGICYLFTMMPSVSLAEPVFGWGRVSMQGSIVDTACTIAVESRDQTININVVPVADIMRNGHGSNKPLIIKLSNCDLPRSDHQLKDRKHFQVTFDGDAEGDLFKVQGTASGIALQISDVIGNVAKPGEPLPLEGIIPGDMTLHYTLKLLTNNRDLKAGEYFSSVRFKLDYF